MEGGGVRLSPLASSRGLVPAFLFFMVFSLTLFFVLGCNDYYSRCAALANLCRSSQWMRFMKHYCAKTCGYCGNPVPPTQGPQPPTQGPQPPPQPGKIIPHSFDAMCPAWNRTQAIKNSQSVFIKILQALGSTPGEASYVKVGNILKCPFFRF